MKKLISIALSALLLVIAPGCNPSLTSGKNGSFSLHETPQMYVLVEEDGVNSFSVMPTVTLYENGNARLSQPMISSIGLPEIGRYQVNGDELTVSYNENTNAAFAISDGGNMLTLKSASLIFTKVGAVYKYISRKDYFSKYDRVGGKELTLEALRELAHKGPSLTLADFEQYACIIVDPDYKIYDVEGDYTLTVIYDINGNTSCMVEHNASGERFQLNLNGSTGLMFDVFLGIAEIPEYEPRKWLDYLYDEDMPWDASIDLSLPEFPGVTFTWTPYKVMADGRDLINGMPVWSVYLADLTNDGKPEFCATVSIGSGIVDTRVIVYDYSAGMEYQLADRMTYSYYLSMQDGKLMVTQTGYNDNKPIATTELQLVNGEIMRFGNLP